MTTDTKAAEALCEEINGFLTADPVARRFYVVNARDYLLKSEDALRQLIKENEALSYDLGECKVHYSDLKGTHEGQVCDMCNYLERATCYEQKDKLREEIKQLKQQHAQAVEAAYKEGYYASPGEWLRDKGIELDWQSSQAKQRLEEG